MTLCCRFDLRLEKSTHVVVCSPLPRRQVPKWSSRSLSEMWYTSESNTCSSHTCATRTLLSRGMWTSCSSSDVDWPRCKGSSHTASFILTIVTTCSHVIRFDMSHRRMHCIKYRYIVSFYAKQIRELQIPLSFHTQDPHQLLISVRINIIRKRLLVSSC